MRSTVVRIAAASLALAAMFSAPAAAVTSLELPGTSTPPVVTAPTAPGVVTPDAAVCDVIPWWFWCRR